ncbi:MAG: ABC transporter ATP-binding protein [Candidatus Zixiibacteriota bacterium]|nr:MAG: ABC transporter ATP-binding protein [candidate division Zixibacteria bacterium]
MVKLKNVEKVYRTESIETLALHDINIEVEKGEFVSVMGPSGCGKSTLLNLMGLLDNPTRGEVEIEGNPVKSYGDRKMAKIRNEKIGFIFQSFHLINDLNVVDNVEIPLLYRRESSSKRRKLALSALEKVGLSARTKHFPSQLSGGQCQRVAIARAIVGKPDLILADEPTGNLDSVMGGEVMDILMNLHENEKTTIVMVTHDERLAGKTERLIRLFDGSQVD